MFSIIKFIILIHILLFKSYIAFSSEQTFTDWLTSYKASALKKGISQKTLDIAFKDVKFIDKIIKYDRKQPEFFEDTITYVNKRANNSRKVKAKNLLNNNKEIFKEVEKRFSVEKEILLSLWGIETNFGKHVGKMDIISALATLSYDLRRRDFFSNQLFILLKLIDKEIIEPSTLYGSWAGAFGNFQFMPSTIERYALDYDGNKKIQLKSSFDDSLASAANYLNKIGWKKNQPCFYRVKLNQNVNEKYINTSARGISNRLKISKWKKMGISNFDGTELEIKGIDLDINGIQLTNKLKAALIQPDGKSNTPTYLVFSNYEIILKWNRSLRFGISVCTLANMIKT